MMHRKKAMLTLGRRLTHLEAEIARCEAKGKEPGDQRHAERGALRFALWHLASMEVAAEAFFSQLRIERAEAKTTNTEKPYAVRGGFELSVSKGKDPT